MDTMEDKKLKRRDYDKQYYRENYEEISRKKRDKRNGLIPKFQKMSEEERYKKIREAQKRYYDKKMARMKELENLEQKILEKGIQV